MAAARYEETPLHDIMGRRKQLYEGMIRRLAPRVYASGDVNLIERFEVGISGLVKMIEKETGKKVVSPRVPRKKPELTYEIYEKERRAGKTNAQIRESYHMSNPKSISGYGLQYHKKNK
jgi:hypothetical protein